MKPHALVWSQRAASDLRQIHAYIAFDKPRAASNFISTIKESVERLRRFPHSGRIVPELMRPDVREILVGNYRIVYKLEKRRVVVLTVFEAHRSALT